MVAPLSVSLIAMLSVQGAAYAEQAGASTQTKTEKAKTSEGEEKLVVSDKKAVNPSATVNLVNILLQQGVITQEQADGLIPQVDDEAFVTRQAVTDATTKADEAAKAASAAASAATPPGSKRISYVPEVVKKQLREEIRKEVMTQAKDEGWASPGKYPEWASRMRFYGDLRGRWEGQFFPDGGYNANAGNHVDFNAINTGSPYDVSDGYRQNGPLFNTTEDRNRFRLRARLGLDADLSDGFTAGMRLATGSDSSPVSTNQTLGGSGGNFSKYSIWLDRAFLKYDLGLSESPFAHYGMFRNTDMTVTIGRFDNPFWSPTDLVWDSDLGFDGVAFQGKREVRPGLTTFAAGGAFPIFNTALDFASVDPIKTESHDKYLLGGQLGFNWQVRPALAFTFGASYFDYENVQGELSSPCDTELPNSACDTDHFRPSFAQKGNTYMPLRDIIIPSNVANPASYPRPQYFGLASEFRPFVASARVDFGNFHPVHVVFDGEFVWNTAFNKAEAGEFATNNRGPDPNGDGGYNDPIVGAYEGGNIGWMAKLTVGHQQFTEFGNWNAHLGYKYLESDATLDAFADSDFGLGGTNLKGYFVGGNFAFSKSVFATAKWMSANGIAGAPYAVDVVQLDINAKF
jgi:hypothetical protein